MLLYDSGRAETLESSAPDVISHPKSTHALTLLQAVLSGLLASGLGIDTLSAVLGIAQTEIFKHLGNLGLELPPAKVIRKSGGKNTWHPDDIRRLIALWLAGVDVNSIAKSLGRSRASIYYKKRRLALPARDRRGLHTSSVEKCRRIALPWDVPPVELLVVSPVTDPPQPPTAAVQAALKPLPPPFISQPAPLPLRSPPSSLAIIVRKQDRLATIKKIVETATTRNSRKWTPEIDNRLIELAFANLRYQTVAQILSSEFSRPISAQAAASHAGRIEIKRDERNLLSECVLEDVPRLAEEMLESLDAELHVCIKIGQIFFTYGPKDRGRRVCREYRVSKKFEAARSIDSAMESYG